MPTPLRHRMLIGLIAVACIACFTPRTLGSVVDLTPGAGSSGYINDAFFSFNEVQPSGTGVFEPFVRIQSHGTQQGYNTSGRPLPFDEKSSIWTHDLQLGSLSTVAFNGGDYYQFALDINESQGGGNGFLSLDAVQIYTSVTGGQTTTDIGSLGTLRYDLDAGEDSFVLLDAGNSHGSGSSDMSMLIPIELFMTASAEDYVYLYSAFGEQGITGSGNNRRDFGSSGGFEEWAAAQGPTHVVPEPASLGLFAAGAALILGRRRRKIVA